MVYNIIKCSTWGKLQIYVYNVLRMSSKNLKDPCEDVQDGELKIDQFGKTWSWVLVKLLKYEESNTPPWNEHDEN